MAALILSRLVHVLEVGESPQSIFVCGGEGEYGATTESLIITIDRFLPSFAVFVGVDGPPDKTPPPLRGIAVGRALKNRWEYFDASSLITTTAAAPAVYAKVGAEERESNAVGEETVVPIMRLSDRPDSYSPARSLLGDLGVRGNGELFEEVSRSPKPVFAAKVLGFDGVEDILSHEPRVERDQGLLLNETQPN